MYIMCLLQLVVSKENNRGQPGLSGCYQSRETARFGGNLDYALPEHNFALVKQVQQDERY